MKEVHYPLHGRSGEYLRPITAAEVREMQAEGKCEVEWSRRGKIKRVTIASGAVMLRFPVAARTIFRERVAESRFSWTHSRAAHTWAMAV